MARMESTRIVRLLLLIPLVVLLLFGGCGRKTRIETHNTTTTMGQELIDLEQAYEQGIISKHRYERAKRDIVKRYR